LPSSVSVSSISPVAIFMTWIALPITSAGRFSPLGPLGIYPPFGFLKGPFRGRMEAGPIPVIHRNTPIITLFESDKDLPFVTALTEHAYYANA